MSRWVVPHKRNYFPRNRFGHLLGHPRWRDPRPARPQRERQDYSLEIDEWDVISLERGNPRSGSRDRRLGPHPAAPRHRIRYSRRRSLPPLHGRGKCRPDSHFGKLGHLANRCSRRRNAPACRPRPSRIRGPPPARAFRRPAPTRRRRARPRRRSSHPAYGRAFWRARSRHPCRTSARIQRPHPPPWQDHRLRHPRSPRSLAPRFAHRPARSRPHRCQRPATGISSPRPPRSTRFHFVSRFQSRISRVTPQMTTWSFFADHRPAIIGAALDHLTLVVIAMVIAILIGVPLGMFIVQRPALRAIALGIASIFQTIPSLALFGFLIPIPFIGGIGKPTPNVAPVPYARLPILRNP